MGPRRGGTVLWQRGRRWKDGAEFEEGSGGLFVREMGDEALDLCVELGCWIVKEGIGVGGGTKWCTKEAGPVGDIRDGVIKLSKGKLELGLLGGVRRVLEGVVETVVKILVLM